MAAAEPGPPAGRSGGSSLRPRLLVGAGLILLALAAIYAGAWVFTAFAALVAILLFEEWGVMHGIPRSWRKAGHGLLAVLSLFAHAGEVRMALLLLVAMALALAFFASSPAPRLAPFGILYAGLPMLALIRMRDTVGGAELVLWAMGVVWATDILAYFTGRAIGGPRIWPAASPNKTWAGLFGGMLGAALFALLFARAVGWGHGALLWLLLGMVLAVVAQAGDFFESLLKRRAGGKDSGTLLPGHGGVMDRLDGLVPVACLVGLWLAFGQGGLWLAFGGGVMP